MNQELIEIHDNLHNAQVREAFWSQQGKQVWLVSNLGDLSVVDHRLNPPATVFAAQANNGIPMHLVHVVL